MQETDEPIPSSLSPAAKRPCLRVVCPHRFMSNGDAEELERYLQSRLPLLAERIPVELLQGQLAAGCLLPPHVVGLLVRRLLAARAVAAAVPLHSILQKNLELVREHDVVDNGGPLGDAPPLRCPSLWCSSDLKQCLAVVQEVCAAGGATPLGPQLFLQYVLECMRREVLALPLPRPSGEGLQRELMWMPCGEAIAELLSQVLFRATQGESFCVTGMGCPHLADLLMEVLCTCGQASASAQHSVCVLLLSTVEQLSSFAALRAFFRALHYHGMRVQLADMVLSTKFSTAIATEDHPPGHCFQPSLQRTLTEHFMRLPDPEVVGMWSSCACLLMLLCYLVQYQLEMPGLDPAHSRQAIRTAVQGLTEQLSEDTRLFSQLTAPDCWFYLQYLTCLTSPVP